MAFSIEASFEVVGVATESELRSDFGGSIHDFRKSLNDTLVDMIADKRV